MQVKFNNKVPFTVQDGLFILKSPNMVSDDELEKLGIRVCDIYMTEDEFFDYIKVAKNFWEWNAKLFKRQEDRIYIEDGKTYKYKDGKKVILREQSTD